MISIQLLEYLLPKMNICTHLRAFVAKSARVRGWSNGWASQSWQCKGFESFCYSSYPPLNDVPICTNKWQIMSSLG